MVLVTATSHFSNFSRTRLAAGYTQYIEEVKALDLSNRI